MRLYGPVAHTECVESVRHPKVLGCCGHLLLVQAVSWSAIAPDKYTAGGDRGIMETVIDIIWRPGD